MGRRSIDWDTGLAKNLRDVKFAQQFIQASLEEGCTLQEVLGKVIRAYGIKEFSAKVKLPAPNILRVINSRHNPTVQSLNRLLKPFLLELSVAPTGKRRIA